jgi:hypothetical protein
MPVAVVILALVVVGAVVGGATVIGAPVLAVPLVALLLLAWGGWTVVRRALGREPRSRQPIRFDAADRATMAPSPSAAERQRTREQTAREQRRA